MKTKVLFILFMLKFSVLVNATETRRVQKSFPVEKGMGIEIESISGLDVDIKTWDKNEISFDFKIKISSDDAEYEKAYIEDFDIVVHSFNSKMIIEIRETEEDASFNFWNIFILKFSNSVSRKITGEIFIPSENSFSADFKYCDISLTDMSGEINLQGRGNKILLQRCKNVKEIKNDYGEVEIENCSGNLKLLSRGSKNIVKNFVGSVEVESDYSDLTLYWIDGELKIKSIDADIDIKDITKSINISADYSDIRISDVLGSVNIEDLGGNIILNNVGLIELEGDYTDYVIKNVIGRSEKRNIIKGRGGNINITTMSGGLFIDGDYSDIDLKSITGDVEIESSSNSIKGNDISGNWISETEYSKIFLTDMISDEVRITNSSEDVKVAFKNIPKKNIIENTYGNVNLILSKDYLGSILVESTYGNIKSDFEFDKIIDNTNSKRRERKGLNNSILNINCKNGNVKLIVN